MDKSSFTLGCKSAATCNIQSLWKIENFPFNSMALQSYNSRFRHVHSHTGTARWRQWHSKFVLCLRHLLIEMPNHSLLICLKQSDRILEVSELHWCKTWSFVWHKLEHTDVEKQWRLLALHWAHDNFVYLCQMAQPLLRQLQQPATSLNGPKVMVVVKIMFI